MSIVSFVVFRFIRRYLCTGRQCIDSRFHLKWRSFSYTIHSPWYVFTFCMCWNHTENNRPFGFDNDVAVQWTWVRDRMQQVLSPFANCKKQIIDEYLFLKLKISIVLERYISHAFSVCGSFLLWYATAIYLRERFRFHNNNHYIFHINYSTLVVNGMSWHHIQIIRFKWWFMHFIPHCISQTANKDVKKIPSNLTMTAHYAKTP